MASGPGRVGSSSNGPSFADHLTQKDPGFSYTGKSTQPLDDVQDPAEGVQKEGTGPLQAFNPEDDIKTPKEIVKDVDEKEKVARTLFGADEEEVAAVKAERAEARGEEPAPLADEDGLFGEGEEQSEEAAEDAENDRADETMSDGKREANEEELRADQERFGEAYGEEVAEEIVALELPFFPRPVTSNGQIWSAHMPHFLSIVPAPFDAARYQEDVISEERPNDTGEAVKLRVQNAIRWRDGTSGKESNARFVRWSDGMLSLQVGEELFDVGMTMLDPSKSLGQRKTASKPAALQEGAVPEARKVGSDKDLSGATTESIRPPGGNSAALPKDVKTVVDDQSHGRPTDPFLHVIEADPTAARAAQSESRSQSNGGHSSSAPQGYVYLSTANRKVALVHANPRISANLTFRPAALGGDTHRQLANINKLSRRAALEREKKSTKQIEIGVDPEKRRLEMEQAEMQKIKESRKKDVRSRRREAEDDDLDRPAVRRSTTTRRPRRARGYGDDEEEEEDVDMEDDDEDGNEGMATRRSTRANPAEGVDRARLGAGYQADDFVVDDDDEEEDDGKGHEGGREEGGDEEVEEIDARIDAQERQRKEEKKKQQSGDPSPKKRIRRVEDDDDDDL